MRGRSRTLTLAACSLICGTLAAAEVQGATRRVEEQVGPAVPVVVARAELEAGTPIRPRTAQLLAVRQVPEAFVPPDSVASPDDVMGAVTARPVPAGSYLTAAYLEGRGDRSAVGAGERVIEIPVTGSAAVGPARPGTRVDVLVTSESRAGRGNTRVALEGAELLRLSRGGGGRDAALDGARADGTAQLLVSPAQAVTLTAAANFAREIRLLQRPVGDTRRIGLLSARDLAR